MNKRILDAQTNNCSPLQSEKNNYFFIQEDLETFWKKSQQSPKIPIKEKIKFYKNQMDRCRSFLENESEKEKETGARLGMFVQIFLLEIDLLENNRSESSKENTETMGTLERPRGTT